MTREEVPQFSLRWWWNADDPHPKTYAAIAPATEEKIVAWCQHGPEVWEQLELRVPTFWVITPHIAREEMALWGPYDDYDHAVMIAATLR